MTNDEGYTMAGLLKEHINTLEGVPTATNVLSAGVEARMSWTSVSAWFLTQPFFIQKTTAWV